MDKPHRTPFPIMHRPGDISGGPSRPERGAAGRCVPPRKGAPLWAWLLLGALVAPGAWSSLDEDQEELLVELHNHYRGQVSPSASAMLPLRWEDSLKLKAEAYAAKCIWNHNPELEDTGENLYANTGPLDLTKAMEKWFLEYVDYDYYNNSCDEDKMCGHYTQMVWADTHRVGCAFHLCDQMEGLGWEKVSFLVCNYYPAGNYEGERPYVEGDWCSRCPDNLEMCENNLCVKKEESEDEDEKISPPPATSDPSLDSEEDEGQTEVELEVVGSTVHPPPATIGPTPPEDEETEEEAEDDDDDDEDDEDDDDVPPATTTSSSFSQEDSLDVQPTEVEDVEDLGGGAEDEIKEKEEEEEKKVEEKKEEEEMKVEEKEETIKTSDKGEEKKKQEEEEDEMKVEKKEEKKKEEKKEEKGETRPNNVRNRGKAEVMAAAASLPPPPLLLVLLTGFLILRL